MIHPLKPKTIVIRVPFGAPTNRPCAEVSCRALPSWTRKSSAETEPHKALSRAHVHQVAYPGVGLTFEFNRARHSSCLSAVSITTRRFSIGGHHCGGRVAVPTPQTK